MIRFLPLLCLGLLCSLTVALRASETLAERTLKQILTDQQEILDEEAKKTEPSNRTDLQAQIQQIADRYNSLLGANPNYTQGYVAYGLLMSKVGMKKEATALMLKANALDSNLAIVKNQLGNYLAEEGKPLEAVNYYMAAIDLAPKESLYHYQLGTLLTEGRDDFLLSGKWTRDTIDKASLEAFHQATLLSPADWRFAYRYGLAFYDLEKPDWEVALAFWKDFENTLAPGNEQQICRLHQAKVLSEMKRPFEASVVLDTVKEPSLAGQKEKLAAELAQKTALKVEIPAAK